MAHRHRWPIGIGVVLALAAALSLSAAGETSSPAQGEIIYVDADATTGGDNGSDWPNAFTDLQEALADAEAGQQIWVAEGTYKPSAEHGGTGDRYRSFQMMNGVAIYGGFDPSVGDDAWEERDWANNETILSGDVGIEGDPDDNAYHVFFHPAGTNLNGTAILDGFTITGGNANSDIALAHERNGGGMHNDGSSPTLANVAFSRNSAWLYGGGVYNANGSAPSLRECLEECHLLWVYGLCNLDFGLGLARADSDTCEEYRASSRRGLLKNLTILLDRYC